MRIAHFISHFPYQAQGSDPDLADRYTCMGGETAAYQLATQLARLGHQITIATSAVDGRDVVETYDGLSIYRYASFGKVGSTRFSPGLNWQPHHDLPPVDLVHVHHTTPPGGLAGMFFAGRRKVPMLVTHHGFENPDRYGSLLRQGLVFLSARYFVGHLFRRADALICISESYMQGSRFLNRYREKVHIIPNGVNFDEYRIIRSREECRRELGLPAGDPIVLYVGSLIQPKGVELLLEALSIVAERFPDLRAVFVGRGPLKAALIQQAQAYGLQDQVSFPGFLPQSTQKEAYYRAADVLVIPSKNEMFPLVLLEGFATGSAVVVSNLQTFQKIVTHKETGLVATQNDAQGFADCIAQLLADPGLRARLSRNAFGAVQQYNWSSVAARTADLYAQICSGSRSTASCDSAETH